MKYEGYIVDTEGDYAEITSEDIAKYPKRYKLYTMYCNCDDMTIIWAIEILCMPDKEIELNRQIISFMYGDCEGDDIFGKSNRKFAEDRFNDFIDYNIIETKQNLLFELEDKQ